MEFNDEKSVTSVWITAFCAFVYPHFRQVTLFVCRLKHFTSFLLCLREFFWRFTTKRNWRTWWACVSIGRGYFLVANHFHALELISNRIVPIYMNEPNKYLRWTLSPSLAFVFPVWIDFSSTFVQTQCNLQLAQICRNGKGNDNNKTTGESIRNGIFSLPIFFHRHRRRPSQPSYMHDTYMSWRFNALNGKIG